MTENGPRLCEHVGGRFDPYAACRYRARWQTVPLHPSEPVQYLCGRHRRLAGRVEPING